MDFFERTDQQIYLEPASYSRTGEYIRYRSTNISQFLSKLEGFLKKKNYGFCIPSILLSSAEAYFNVEPYNDISKVMEGITDYFNNLTSADRKDRFEYLLRGCFFYNTRNQIIWSIHYENPVIQNRLKILNIISGLRNNYYTFTEEHNFDLTKNVESDELNKYQNMAAAMLRYKLSYCKSNWIETKDKFEEFKKHFKSKSLSESLKHENTKDYYNFYAMILNALSWPTEYEN